MITPLPFGGGEGGGANWWLVCEATPIGLLKEGEGMPAGRRESYEAVPRRPEQQGTEGPALSISPVFSVPLLPCLNHTLSLS